MAQKMDQHMPVMGLFAVPHDQTSTNWTGLVADPKTGELVKEPSMTKQSEMAACDINNIVREFTKTGQVSHINALAQQGQFMDLPDSLDYAEAINIALEAQSAFDALPAQVRARFDNDPEKFLGFLHDPKNHDEAIELGLVIPPAPKPLPLDVRVLNPDAPASPPAGGTGGGETSSPSGQKPKT